MRNDCLSSTRAFHSGQRVDGVGVLVETQVAFSFLNPDTSVRKHPGWKGKEMKVLLEARVHFCPERTFLSEQAHVLFNKHIVNAEPQLTASGREEWESNFPIHFEDSPQSHSREKPIQLEGKSEACSQPCAGNWQGGCSRRLGANDHHYL